MNLDEPKFSIKIYKDGSFCVKERILFNSDIIIRFGAESGEDFKEYEVETMKQVRGLLLSLDCVDLRNLLRFFHFDDIQAYQNNEYE